VIKKILIAIDSSVSARNAANYAIQLAKLINAQLEIVYVVKYSPGNIDAGIFPAQVEAEEKEKATQLINMIKIEHPEVKIREFEALGRTATEINKAIHNWQADLLVLGHHTHHFIEKLLNNSVEKMLLKHLKIPVLIIPENYKSL